MPKYQPITLEIMLAYFSYCTYNIPQDYQVNLKAELKKVAISNTYQEISFDCEFA